MAPRPPPGSGRAGPGGGPPRDRATDRPGGRGPPVRPGNLRNKRSKKDQGGEYKCLIRATDGKKKVSTVVSEGEQAKFQAAYLTVLKASMDSLKKRERVKSRSKRTLRKKKV